MIWSASVASIYPVKTQDTYSVLGILLKKVQTLMQSDN